MKSAGIHLRCYCYVLDCVSGIVTAILKGKNGEAYNISNSEFVVTIRGMAEAFVKTAGQKFVFEIATSNEIASFNVLWSSLLATLLVGVSRKGLYV